MLLILVDLVLVGGCSEGYYRQSADDEVYSLLRATGQAEGGRLDLGEGFRVEQEPLELADVGEESLTEDFGTVPEPEPEAPPPVDDGTPADNNAPNAPAPGEEPPGGTGVSEEPSPSPPEKSAAPEPPASEKAASETIPAERAPPGNGPPPGPAAAAETAGASLDTDSDSLDVESVRQGPIPAEKIPARILTLRDALRLAFASNRQYQSARESVYLTALSYTLVRHDFAPRFFGMITGDFEEDAGGEQSGSISSSFGWTQLFANGARLSVSLLNNFFQFFTGNRREVAETIVQASVTQPLLRGFGKHIVQEPLVQARRDVIYEVRSFKRFRKTFAVQVISEYYRALQGRDQVTNEYNNWRLTVDTRARVQAMADAGRSAPFEVDVARQNELQAEDRYFAAVQGYENSLDDFKITLGVPIAESVALDPRELEQLVEAGIERLDIGLTEAILAASRLRLDLATERDQVEDARRRVVVSADALRAQLDIRGDVALPSGEGSLQRPLRFNAANMTYGFGFTLDLPLDRKAERNAYVAALLSRERQRRGLSLFEDNVSLTVRREYRELQRELIIYPIRQEGVNLAEDRVVSTRLLNQAGRVSSREVVEAQEDLIEARNAVTGSLVNYTVARLQLFRDVGALIYREDGEVVVEWPPRAEID
ncbi:MAG: TolC family protein [Planctomycetota bacterium]|nr:TolC family protein [Planctomycetota bacterium]